VKKTRKPSYHHGNLRSALLDAALELVRDAGLGAISLREVARRAGVSHAAPAHHFGDKAGLLTALATRGYELFGEALRAAAARAGDQPQRRLAWVGWAYVMFAAENRAYFEIMFRPELLHVEDSELARATAQAYRELTDSVELAWPDATAAERQMHATRSWSEVHGLATLWLHGNLPEHADTKALDAFVRKICGLGVTVD
jgi:AcrR family transcriptional regulator